MTLSLQTEADVRLARQILGLLPRLGRLWSSTLRETGQPSVVRLRLLGVLKEHGPARAGELATFCGTTPSAVTELIESLVAGGQLTREDDPRDRRAVVVALTARGRTELAQAEERMTTALRARLDSLTAEQRERLESALADLNTILAPTSAHKESAHVQ